MTKGEGRRPEGNGRGELGKRGEEERRCKVSTNRYFSINLLQND